LLRFGIDAEVQPNGIPRRLLKRIGGRNAARVRSAVQKDLVFFKMARWAADKGWPASLKAVAQMRAAGYDVTLVARGNGDPTVGADVVDMAHGLGLKVAETSAADDTFMAKTAALEAAREADVVFMRSFVDEQFGRALYSAADGVLANSTFEPFGLVGLEAMATGGVAYTGGTGEDYALSGYNAVVLDSNDPREIVEHAKRLQSAPQEGALVAQQHGQLLETLRQTRPGPTEKIFPEHRDTPVTKGWSIRPATARQDSIHRRQFSRPHQQATNMSGWRAMASSGVTRTLSTSRSA
jgi:glycosyltransferase involved in cell wall biosynthesis